MSPRLALSFLGPPQIQLDEMLIAPKRRTVTALLAYLTVSDPQLTGLLHTRESLSALLWPEYDQSRAFTNLRHALWEIHKAIGANWLVAERESVRFNVDVNIDLDLARFQDSLANARSQSDRNLRLPRLLETVKLYRNHFLTGFSLKDATDFNAWAFTQAETYRGDLASALRLLVDDYRILGQADSAIPHARRLVALDPLDEAAHRLLMEAYLQAGQHSAALKQYQSCERLLREELGIEPRPETLALYRAIHTGTVVPLQIEKPTRGGLPKNNLPVQLTSFIGREKERDEVCSLLARQRLVALVGAGGIGKTRLALQVGEKLLRAYPQGIWFIALEAIPDPATLPQAVAALFGMRENSERSLTQKLIAVLRPRTTLLILDNCEHLLAASAALAETLLKNSRGSRSWPPAAKTWGWRAKLSIGCPRSPPRRMGQPA